MPAKKLAIILITILFFLAPTPSRAGDFTVIDDSYKSGPERNLLGWAENIGDCISSPKELAECAKNRAIASLRKTGADMLAGLVIGGNHIIMGHQWIVAAMQGKGSQLTFNDVVNSPGLFTNMTMMMDNMYQNPPVLNTAQVVKDTLATNLLNPTPAYAEYRWQTKGSQFYTGAVPMWNKVLTLTLGVSLIVLVIIGFMIMFSGLELPFFKSLGIPNKITVFAVIPNILISLFFAVFSLTIAAVIMDFVNILGMIVLTQFNPTDIGQATGTQLFGSVGPFQVTKAITWPLIKSITTDDIDIFGYLLVFIIMLVALKYGFTLFFSLIKAYVSLYIAVIFAPLLLLIGALPGREKAVGNWVRMIAANSIIFPLVLVVLNMAYYIITLFQGQDFSDPIISGMNLSHKWDPFTGSVTFLGILSLGFLALVSQLPDTIMKMFGVQPSVLVADAMKTFREGLGMYDTARKKSLKLAKFSYNAITQPATTTSGQLSRLPDFAQRGLQRKFPGLAERLEAREGAEADKALKKKMQQPTFTSRTKAAQEAAEKRLKLTEVTKDINGKLIAAGAPQSAEDVRDLYYMETVANSYRDWNFRLTEAERQAYGNNSRDYAKDRLKEAGLTNLSDQAKLLDQFDQAEPLVASYKSDGKTDPKTAIANLAAKGLIVDPQIAARIMNDELQGDAAWDAIKNEAQNKKILPEPLANYRHYYTPRAEEFRRIVGATQSAIKERGLPEPKTYFALYKNWELPALAGMYRVQWQGALIKDKGRTIIPDPYNPAHKRSRELYLSDAARDAFRSKHPGLKGKDIENEYVKEQLVKLGYDETKLPTPFTDAVRVGAAQPPINPVTGAPTMEIPVKPAAIRYQNPQIT